MWSEGYPCSSCYVTIPPTRASGVQSSASCPNPWEGFMAESTVGSVERTTTLAVHEKKKLIKSLRRFDMLLFLVCAIVGLDTLGQVSSYGAQTFPWVIEIGRA